MESLALLVLLAAANVAFSTIQCYEGKWIDNQLPLYEKLHKNMNLTLVCEAVRNAAYAAELLMKGEPNHVNLDFWCKYTADTWSTQGYGDRWVQELPMKAMAWDKVAQTAILHPRTKYGCASLKESGDFYYYYYIACIYEKKAPESRCNIEWSYS
ncbi:hypothetical protein Q1695_003549 [Nippostrongylus brasiliensis]|nr:hypothetical protein Q1695_003549 [Nippostrongylus brasiliensis]